MRVQKARCVLQSGNERGLKNKAQSTVGWVRLRTCVHLNGEERVYVEGLP
jgi:hypothetical protein